MHARTHRIAAVTLASALALTTIGLQPAAAEPISTATGAVAQAAGSLEVSAQRRHYRHYRRGNPAAAAAAVGAFGLIAGAIAANQYRRHYYGPGYYYGPPPPRPFYGPPPPPPPGYW